MNLLGLKKIFIIIINILLMFCCITTYAQTSLTGKVRDKETGKPLAFVNIVGADKKIGTTSNIKGNFHLKITEDIKLIKVSYIGYENRKIKLDTVNSPLVINLKRKNVQIEEVKVQPKKNPAHRIIRKAIRNKSKHNPENLNSFSYNSYNKYILTSLSQKGKFVIQEDTSDEKKVAKKNFSPDSTRLDPTLKSDTINNDTSMSWKEYITNHHLFLIENITKRKHIAPDIDKKTVIASNVSGLNKTPIPAMPTGAQPFHFYDTYIELLEKKFRNPISKGALKKYLFVLQDTLYTSNDDTTFIIAFKPRKNKNFEALKGVISISSNGFAIKNVRAEPFHKGINDIIIEQKYQVIKGNWFPVQLNFELIFNKTGTLWGGKSFLDSIKINPELKRQDIKRINISIKENAAFKDTSFWKNHRIDSLSIKDINTYNYLDSLGREKNLDRKFRIWETVATGKIPFLKYFQLNIDRFIKFNQFENVRLGTGIYTNDSLSKKFNVGGYWGYGIKDNKKKYGINTNIYLDNYQESKLYFKYQNDIIEPGRTNFIKNDRINRSTNQFKDFLASRMNSFKRMIGGIQFRTLRYLFFDISAELNKVTINSDYQFRFSGKDNIHFLIDDHRYNEFNLGAKFAYGETFAKTWGELYSMGSDYPVIWINYSKSISDIAKGILSYQKFESRVNWENQLRGLGKFKIQLEGGWINKPVPATEMYFGKSSFDNNLRLVADNTFQTMRLYEFLSNRYFYLFINYELGKWFIKGTDKFRPLFQLTWNTGYGNINKKKLHKSINFKSMEKGFHETGILIRNIYRTEYMDSFYFGIGIGSFYRIGAYQYDNTIKNLNFKLLFDINI